MNKDFFEPKFQKRIWAFSNSVEYKENECFTNFKEYFTNYKNRSLKTFMSHNIFKNILWDLNEIDELDIKIDLEESFINNYNHNSTAFGVYIPDWVNVSYSNNRLFFHKKQLVITYDHLVNNSISISFNKMFDTRVERFRVAPITVSPSNKVVEYEPNQFFEKDSKFGWNAVDYKILDEYTIQVFFTASPYRQFINFNNLIVRISFSMPLEKIGLEHTF